MEKYAHVVIVGAGFGGLGVAEQLAHVPVNVTLIDRHNNLRVYAKKELQDRGVELRLGEAVAEIEPTFVRLKSGAEIKTHNADLGRRRPRESARRYAGSAAGSRWAREA
jgi:NADH dehydrogenase FAD-containing subunit